ncbi:MAG: IPT/TIG domain-containing protein [Xanthomarina gelatinilytica]|uniref:IPT/TIG domain-containing protein n=1 Tax=Xanthomarina gelatinilytica TaxID=1137281 RepID=UPI003A83BF38
MRKTVFLIFVICFVSCSKDDGSKANNLNSLLQVTTVSSSILQDGGVKLNGNIDNLQTTASYGFIISTYPGGTLNINNPDMQIMTLNGMFNGNFSMEFRNNLQEGLIYYYNAYVFSDNNYFFGQEKQFISNGSASPIIDLVEPQIAHIGDTITLKGQYFSNDFAVRFEDVLAINLLESDTLIKTIVPFHYTREEPYNTISVKKETGEETVFSDFSMYTPVVNSVEPYYAHENDTITIIGNHFSLENYQNLLSMDIHGNYSGLEIVESSRTELKFVNAGWFYEVFPKLKLKSQFQTIEFDDKFEAKMP